MMLQNKWFQVLVIYCAATIIWAFVDPAGQRYGAIRIGELIGAGITFLLVGLFIAHIPATIFRFARGTWPNWQIWLAAPFSAIFMYFAYVGSSEPTSDAHSPAGVSQSTTEYWFTEDHCEISVRFPGRPSFRTNHAPGGLQAREAHYNTESGFHLRAECTDYGGIWDGQSVSARDEDWVGWMSAFMSAEGLNNPQISSADRTTDTDPVIIDGRGYKRVGDVAGTYIIRLIAADRSIMILYVGGPSGSFPSREANDFLNSYR